MNVKTGPHSYQLDDADIKILEQLQSDARIPLTQLSEQLGIPHSTVRHRLQRMEEAGVIEKYAVVINPVRVGFLIDCFVEVTLDHRVETDAALKALSELEEVIELYILTGEIDVLARICARDVEHLREILYERFTQVPGLVRTNTLVILGAQVKTVTLRAKDAVDTQVDKPGGASLKAIS